MRKSADIITTSCAQEAAAYRRVRSALSRVSDDLALLWSRGDGEGGEMIRIMREAAGK